MSTEDMRWLLKNRTKYSHSEKWIKRVDLMHPAQVFAVYTRMERSGEILK